MSYLPNEPASEARKGDCNATDGYSYCTNPPGHGPTHWDRRTQHEWYDDEPADVRAAAPAGPLWVIEFPAQSVGQAIDIVRQHIPDGQGWPHVQEGGRKGYEAVTADYALIEAITAHVGHDRVIVSKR